MLNPKVFWQAKDKYLVTRIGYIEREAMDLENKVGELYWDPEFTKPAKLSEALDAFLKNQLIICMLENSGDYKLFNNLTFWMSQDGENAGPWFTDGAEEYGCIVVNDMASVVDPDDPSKK